LENQPAEQSEAKFNGECEKNEHPPNACERTQVSES